MELKKQAEVVIERELTSIKQRAREAEAHAEAEARARLEERMTLLSRQHWDSERERQRVFLENEKKVRQLREEVNEYKRGLDRLRTRSSQGSQSEAECPRATSGRSSTSCAGYVVET